MNTAADPHSTAPAASTAADGPRNRWPDRRVAAIAGLIAGPLFLAVVVALTVAERGYLRAHGWRVLDHGDVPWPSGLALAGLGWLLILTFAVTGLLLLVFVRGARREFPRRRSATVAAGLLTVLALAVIALAAPTDRDFGGTPTSWHGWVHGLGYITLALGSFLAPLVTARALRGDPRWRPMARVSLAVGLVQLVLFLVPATLGFYAFLALVFGWFTALAAQLARIANTERG